MRRYLVTAVLAKPRSSIVGFRRTLIGVSVMAALLTGCASNGTDSDYEGDGGPAVVEGKIIGKGIYDGCNRLTLARVDRVKNRRTKLYESKVAIGYICIPRPAWDDLKVDDRYEVPKP